VEKARLRCLVVEDDDDHALILLRTLKSTPGVESVERVQDGAEALAYLRGEGMYQNRTTPHVVLLDLKLPRVDGHQVLAEAKQDERLRPIPIVVLTTSDADSDRARAYENHANSYLVKSPDFTQFFQMIRDLTQYWSWNRPATI
jgi:CheY-like chemotaxis protein